MSSFTKHVENVEDLKEMGFDVSDCIKDGNVTMDSWGYDDLTYLLSDVISELIKQGFKVDNNDN